MHMCIGVPDIPAKECTMCIGVPRPAAEQTTMGLSFIHLIVILKLNFFSSFYLVTSFINSQTPLARWYISARAFGISLNQRASGEPNQKPFSSFSQHCI